MHPLEERLQLPNEFRGFNPRAAMRVYHRNLPHWRQPGATYFLTFRLGDSVPSEVIDDIQRERRTWQRRLEEERAKHGDALPDPLLEDYQAFLLQTYRRLEKVMDAGHGSCLLRETTARDVVSDALKFFHGERYEMHVFVVMPNHVHLSVRPLDEWQIEQLVQSWKSFSSKAINKRMGRTGTLWQEDCWDRIVRDDAHWFRVMRYILRNPDNAKLLQGQSTVWVCRDLLGDPGGTLHESCSDEEPW
jgi:REP element-mobilizing transposase RayT